MKKSSQRITSDDLVKDFCSFLPSVGKVKCNVVCTKSNVKEESFIINKPINCSYQKNNITTNKESKKSTFHNNGNDIDVFSIDVRIKRDLENEKKKVKDMERKKKRLAWIKEHSPNPIEIKRAEEEIYKICKEIKSISEDSKLLEYKTRTENILKEIKEIIEKPASFSFVGNNQEEQEKMGRKNELIYLYFSVASKFTYISPNFLPDESKKNVCECGSINFDMSEEGKRICVECATTINIFETDLSFKDTERINLIPRYNYSKPGHFKAAMDNFEGVQNKTIPQHVYDVIYMEIDRYDIYTRKTITKTAIYNILSKHRLGDYYEDINLIHHNITGKPPPSITQYRSILMKMNEKFEKEYDVVKKEFGKKNALNVNHKLMRFLEQIGYYANEEDLIGLKTESKKQEHDDAIEITFKRLRWTPKWKF